MYINSLSPNSPYYSTSGYQAKNETSQATIVTNQANYGMVASSLEVRMAAQDSDRQNTLQTDATSSSENESAISGAIDGFMDGAASDGMLSLDEILAFAEKNQDKADQVLAQTFARLGISPETEVNITTDTNGYVRVTSPDLSSSRVKMLEQALNDHPDFQQYHTKAASFFLLYFAAEQHT